MPSDISLASFLKFFFPKSWMSYINILGTEGQKLISLAASHTAGGFQHSVNFFPFLCGRDHGPLLALSCTLLSPSLFFFSFLQLSAETSQLELLTSTKVLLSMGTFPMNCFAGGHKPEARESTRQERVSRFLPFLQPHPSSVCLFSSAQMGQTLHGLLPCHAGSHNSNRGIFVCGQQPNFPCWVVSKAKRRDLYHHNADIISHHISDF